MQNNINVKKGVARLLALIGLSILGFVAGACSGNPATPIVAATPIPSPVPVTPTSIPATATVQSTATSTSVPTPTKLAIQLPLALGTYTIEKTPHGPEELRLEDGDSYTEILKDPDIRRAIRGTWTLALDRVTFTESLGGECTGKPGTYTWTFDGTAITFTKVQDDCSARAADWVSGPWIKQP